jgi:nucleotide-binding universal stress UspA family protein
MDIVIAVDLNAEPRSVVDAAIGWARQLRATLHLRTVSALQWHDDPELTDPGVDVLEDAWSHLRRIEVQAVQRLLRRVPEPMRGTAAVLQGPAPSAIVAAAVGADLVVCATRGRTGLSRLFLGSTSEAIVRASDTPTLVLRLGAAPRSSPAERILVPIDPAAPSAAALDAVSRWFPDARLTLAAVLDPLVPGVSRGVAADRPTAYNHPDRDWALRVLESLLPRTGSGRADLLFDEAVGTGGCIAAAAARHDLVAVTTRRRQGISHLWWGSVAEQVARLAPVPTLVVGARPNAWSRDETT